MAKILLFIRILPVLFLIPYAGARAGQAEAGWAGLETASALAGNTTKVLFEGDSGYSRILVTERGTERCLIFGPRSEHPQTCVNTAKPDESVFEYTAMMFVGLLFNPGVKKICLIGLGGGYIPTVFRMHLPGIHLTIVELDPMVCRIAERFFGFRPTPNQQLAIDDGRSYLEKNWAVFDQIWLDAFDSDSVPERLTTVEFLSLCKSRLSRNGLVVQNAHRIGRQYADQLATYRHVFSHVYVFEGTKSGNAVIVAADRPLCPPPLYCRKQSKAGVGRIDLRSEARKQKQVGTPEGAKVLRDPAACR